MSIGDKIGKFFINENEVTGLKSLTVTPTPSTISWKEHLNEDVCQSGWPWECLWEIVWIVNGGGKAHPPGGRIHFIDWALDCGAVEKAS